MRDEARRAFRPVPCVVRRSPELDVAIPVIAKGDQHPQRPGPGPGLGTPLRRQDADRVACLGPGRGRRPERPGSAADAWPGGDTEAMCRDASGTDAGGRLSLGSRRRPADGMRRTDRISDLRSKLQELRPVDRVQVRCRYQQRRLRAITAGERRLRSANLAAAAGWLQHGCHCRHREDRARVCVQGG